MAVEFDRVVVVVVFVLVFTVAGDLDDDIHGVHGVSLLIGLVSHFKVLLIVLTDGRTLTRWA